MHQAHLPPDGSAPRRVLHIVNGAHWSGGEQSLFLLLKYLDRTRYEPTVICLAPGLLHDRLVAMGVPTHIVLMSGRFDLRVVRPISRIIRRIRPDLVVTQTSRTNLLGRLARLCSPGIPVVSVVQAPISRDTNHERPSRLNGWVERVTSPLTRGYIAVSNGVTRDLATLGVREDRVRVIYNSFDPDILHNAPYEQVLRAGNEGHLLVGMVASFRPRKGAEFLIDAMPEVLRRVPEARVVLAGHGGWVEGEDYLETLRKRALALGVESSLQILGFREDVPEILASLDVMVLPSLFGEGSSLVLMEAMALGRPVVASDTEGNDEVVEDGISGLLVPSSDAASLATAIVRLLEDPELARRLARAGQQRAKEQFAADAMARQYMDEYDLVLGVST